MEAWLGTDVTAEPGPSSVSSTAQSTWDSTLWPKMAAETQTMILAKQPLLSPVSSNPGTTFLNDISLESTQACMRSPAGEAEKCHLQLGINHYKPSCVCVMNGEDMNEKLARQQSGPCNLQLS